MPPGFECTRAPPAPPLCFRTGRVTELCNTKWGRGVWPFFQPLIMPHAEGGFHYLGEDWAFSQRLSQIGITPLADTSIRLWHYGRYGFGWEDAGADPPRYRTYRFRP